MKCDIEKTAVVLKFVSSSEASKWHSGPGWYWWEEEYPEDGCSGPYTTVADAIADMSDDHYLAGEVGP